MTCPTHPINCPGHWHVETFDSADLAPSIDAISRAAERLAAAGFGSIPQRWLLGAPTPKEAPMPTPRPYPASAPFTYTDRDGDDLTLTAETNDGHDDVYLVASDVGVYVTKEDAPAVALAILQAAGIRGTHVWTATSVESAVAFLTLHVEAEARKKADAEKAAATETDAAKLDEEAQAIREAMLGDELYARRWADLSPRIMSEYRAAARKARELHGKA